MAFYTYLISLLTKQELGLDVPSSQVYASIPFSYLHQKFLVDFVLMYTQVVDHVEILF